MGPRLQKFSENKEQRPEGGRPCEQTRLMSATEVGEERNLGILLHTVKTKQNKTKYSQKLSTQAQRQQNKRKLQGSPPTSYSLYGRILEYNVSSMLCLRLKGGVPRELH